MTQRNFLCCTLAGGRIAVPLERVIGVVECGLVTPVPFSAAAFEGLVEAFGQVMPQVDLARNLGSASIPGGFLVVVSDRGGSLALRVSRVLAMVQADGEAFGASITRAREIHPLFMGEIWYREEMFSAIDLDLLAISDELDMTVPEGAVILAEAALQEGPSEAAAVFQIPFLLVEVGGERYAIPSGSVTELAVSVDVRRMPGSPSWIAGLIDLRGTPLAAVCVATMLGLSGEGAPAPDVCLIVELEPGISVGLFVHRALGLERVSPELVFPMTQAMCGIESYLVLGRSDILGIIDPAKLLSQRYQELLSIVPRKTAAQDDADSRGARGNVQQLLTVRVGREIYGMTLDRIKRIQASVKLTPLPSNVDYFDGMADVGDAVVPVIDLRRQQGEALQLMDPHKSAPCILTQLEGATTGILVDQVLSIQNVPIDSFQTARDVSRLPISNIVSLNEQLISVLSIDRLLPPAEPSQLPNQPT